MKHFDPLYDQKARVNATKRKLLICLTKLAKLKLNLQDLTKVSAKPFERKGSYIFFAAVKEGKIYTICEYSWTSEIDVENDETEALSNGR